ncbi:tyrosine-type recombinase/integrase [Paraburkholderia sp. Tr-20389]|uniref:tyrosine-type recombinase/integrase n=1 Tax=Paraburkholderia sp. Tr-20389 TaxID=2703903 RepID=UPI0019806E85|nr:tyrosine-type recombinase/integrase [Paraburkholderia sp. Tr-20389]MBN3757489.1 tyrosine-type recombinase/integrase [Paraburkholderia sp. Tr-20389]
MNFGFEARLMAIRAADAESTVLSSGDTICWSFADSAYPIYSVLDSSGAVVRTMHNWLRHLREQAGLTYSSNTIPQYGRTLSYLCRWMERNRPFPSINVDEYVKLLSRTDLVHWLNAMKAEGAESHNTLHSREACVKEFLDWLTTIEGGRIRDSVNSPWGRDGTLGYITATPNARSPKFISAEIVIELLSGMHNECERCMFHAQYDMGLRIAELVDLTVADIPDGSLYNSAFELIPVSVQRGKGRADQRPEKTTLISRAVLRRIHRYHNSREYKLAPDWDINDPVKPAFLTANQLKWSARNASKQFKSALRRAGLNDDMSTHWMRHGTAYSVLRSDIGKDYQDRMLLIKEMLGHRNLTTTEIYTQISPALLQQITKAGKKINRLCEAEFIRERTFLGPLQHSERRGHRE